MKTSRVLMTALLALSVISFAPRAAAQWCQPQLCGGGEIFCRCEGNLYTDLTKVTLAPGTREYMDARLLELAPGLIQNWRPGDILFVGDSLTDCARLDFNPLIPRSSNIGILGAKIVDVAYSLDLFEQFFASPSRVIVLAGANNIMSTHDSVPRFIQSDFQALLDRLKAFQLRHGCEVFIRSVPPAEVTPPPGFGPVLYHWMYNAAVREANAYLQQACTSAEYPFRFINEYDVFWDTHSNGLFRHNYSANRYASCTGGPDYLHFGCNGFMTSIARVTAQVFPLLPTVIQPIDQFGGPTAPPESLMQFPPGTTFRYAQITIPPGRTLNVSVFGSSYNYAAIFDPYAKLLTPGFPHGYPATEMERHGHRAATISTTNYLGVPLTVTVCMGTAADQMGQYFSIVSANSAQW